MRPLLYSLLCCWCFIWLNPAVAQVSFKPNQGQWNSRALFKADAQGVEVFYEKAAITYQILHPLDWSRSRGQHGSGKDELLPPITSIRAHAFRIEYLNAAADASLQGLDKKQEYFNYFLGKDPQRWAAQVPAFQRLKYQKLYPGIDLLVSNSSGGFKYDYWVSPGANPSAIQFKIQGADAELIQGTLQINTSAGIVKEQSPLAWQEKDHVRIPVKCIFKNTSGVLSFDFPEGYNPALPLVIDPDLVFSTYSGSTADNFGYTATYDRNGNAYAAGSVFWIGQYPVTLGAFQVSWAGGVGEQQPTFPNGQPNPSGTGTDIAITKYSADGLSRIYSTYLGGNGDELPHSLVVNSNDELFVFGTSGSSNYPTTPGAFDQTFGGGPDPGPFNGLAVHYLAGSDMVITRFNADGTALLASTYVGGSDNDGLNFPISQVLNYNYADEVRGEIDIDAGNNVYVASCTRSDDFPVSPNAIQFNRRGGMEACVFKMDNSLSNILWSTFLGGSNDDAAYSISFDKGDSIYVAGGTASSDFPVTPGTFQTLNRGGRADGFIARIDPTGLRLLQATYLGSSAYDQIYFVEVNRNGEVFALGQTETSDSSFIDNANYNVPGSGQFITKLNASLNARVWSTVFGSGRGRPDISPTAFLVDLCNKVYMAGWGSFSNAYSRLSTFGLPVTPDAYQPATDGRDFYLMVMEDDASALSYATFFGGNINGGEHVDGGTSRFDKKGVIYESVCAGCGAFSDFPTFPSNVVSTTNNSPNCNNAVFKFDFKLPVCIADPAVPPAGCVPVNLSFTNNSLAQGDSVTYLWSFGDGDTSTQFEPTHRYDSAGVYTVTLIVRDPESCNGADTAQLQLVLLDGVNDTVPDVAMCPGANRQIGFTLSGNTTGITYQWQPTTFLSNPNASDPFTFTPQTTTYTLQVSNGLCQDVFTQTVRVLWDTIFTDGAAINCPGDTARLQAGNAFADYPLQYVWTPSNQILEGQNTARPLVTSLADQWFNVTGTNALGCVYNDSALLQVTSFLGNLQISATPQEIAYGDTSQLLLTPLTNELITWDFHLSLSEVNIANPLAFPLVTTTYAVSVSDPAGCNLRDSITVFVKRTPCSNNGLFIPSAFSPNGDGNNDVLFIRGNDITELLWSIYDRWGQLVFQTNDLQKGWDGNFEGKPLDAAVFGFQLKGKCKDGSEFEDKGNVTLLR